MKNFIFILVLIFNLTGCVGYTYSKNGEVVYKPDFSPVANFKYRETPPDRKADKINPDGSESYFVYDETKWCGLTVFAIIPIPLWLPTCHAYTEVIYKDGKPLNVATQWPHASGSLCGPLVPMIQMSSGFCQTHNDW
jgi:hypothetical protein